MTDGQQTIESAISEADSLRRVLKRGKTAQVRSGDEKQLVKATAFAWFNNHRPVLVAFLDDGELKPVDDFYRSLIAGADRATLRNRYVETIHSLHKKLGRLLADHAVLLSKPASIKAAVIPTGDDPPDFGTLIADVRMQAILQKRWKECVICVQSRAPLAATVMMGGILEGLLLARINQRTDKSPVFTASAAPRDKATAKTLPLKEWTLRDYINVAHELTWITTTGKDVGEVLRDYRNYIHPQKELSHGISLGPDDAEMLWTIAKSIAVQVLKP